jgi:hypothetical protein
VIASLVIGASSAVILLVFAASFHVLRPRIGQLLNSLRDAIQDQNARLANDKRVHLTWRSGTRKFGNWRRIVHYWRVRIAQATGEERLDVGLFVAVVVLLADVLIVAAR